MHSGNSGYGRALVLSGAGRYADPWHPFEETSAALAEVLSTAGLQVEQSTDVDGSLQRLDEVDLLAVNTGDPWRNGETGRGAPADAMVGLDAALARGIAVLVLHTAVTSLRDYPSWAAAVGAIWLPEISGHPPLDDFTVRLRADSLHAAPLLEGQSDFTVTDEQYSFLQRVGSSTVLAEHTHAGEQHPLVWVRRHQQGQHQQGRHQQAKVAVDLLGHDLRSYESAEHRRLLNSLVSWLTADD